MKTVFYFLVILVMTSSCVAPKIKNHYIQFHHKNPMIMKGSEITIKLIPTKSERKKSVVVQITRNNEQYDNKKVSYKVYQELSNVIENMSQENLTLPKNVAIIDGGSNSIILKKDTLNKKLNVYGFSKEHHGHFYEATLLILQAAKLDISDIR